jgi:acetylornithine deacetylase/succinyl-diaminopimelate desuccinylase-like protein
VDVDLPSLRSTIERLALLDRAPCSEGEHDAAQWIAAELARQGCVARVEPEQVHGSFHTPLGLLALAAAAGGVAALRGHRLLGALAGTFSAGSMWEDLSGGARRPFRRALRQDICHNVVAEAGDRNAGRTLVVMAHHDAARSSFLFDERVPRIAVEHFGWWVNRIDRWPPLMGLVVGAPTLVAAGSLTGWRRGIAAGTAAAAATAAVMRDMARNDVVPGANDNLTAVAALVELARLVRERPIPGLRLLLVSTGAEEANQEGMLAFAARHFGSLPRDTTDFLCLETIGSPELVMIEGEGFLRMRDYPDSAKELVQACAHKVGVHMRRGLRLTFGTDGLIPLRHGYRVASIGSVNEYLVPSNYHKPTDTPENVRYDSVADATRLSYAVAEELASSNA